MSDFSVDPDTLKRVSNELDDLAQEYAQESKDLRNEATTMGTNYQSADNKKFVEQIETLCDELDAFTKKLETASETLNQQALDYRTQEEDNTGVASSLRTSA